MAFTSGRHNVVNREDARIALQLWADELAQILQADYHGDSAVYDSAADAVADVVAGHVTLVILTSPDYLT